MKFFLCDAIYMGNTQQTSKNRMEGRFTDVQRLLKNGQKLDSFAAHFEQHFQLTASCTDLRKCMTFKVVNQFNQIESLKSFMKPNCNLFME